MYLLFRSVLINIENTMMIHLKLIFYLVIGLALIMPIDMSPIITKTDKDIVIDVS